MVNVRYDDKQNCEHPAEEYSIVVPCEQLAKMMHRYHLPAAHLNNIKYIYLLMKWASNNYFTVPVAATPVATTQAVVYAHHFDLS